MALAKAPLVSTRFGEVEGSALPGDMAEFVGIPFAEPPVGALRFAAPVDWQSPYMSDYERTCCHNQGWP